MQAITTEALDCRPGSELEFAVGGGGDPVSRACNVAVFDPCFRALTPTANTCQRHASPHRTGNGSVGNRSLAVDQPHRVTESRTLDGAPGNIQLGAINFDFSGYATFQNTQSAIVANNIIVRRSR
ncbi:hypothetical protein D3C80_1000440 [compost metagenome]